MFVEKTTSRDRLSIDDAVGPIMMVIERATRMLGMAIERYHTDRQDQNIPDYMARNLFDELLLIHNELYAAALDYNLTIGNGKCPQVMQTLESLERVKLAIEVDDRQVEKKLAALRSGGATEDLQRLAELPDEEAIHVLTDSVDTDSKRED